MALTPNNGEAQNADDHLTIQANGQGRVELPSSDFIADSAMSREGNDLILQSANGETIVVEGYFTAIPTPMLASPNGAVLSPNLVQSFLQSPMQYAANDTASDESPVGAVEEIKGNATVTRADGTVETISIGTPIYQGDVIETDASGAVNIVFMDETSMAVSQNARLAIDEYKFDPSTESGTTNFSVLRGLFVFTSGLIGRDDPDDVKIDTPVGSIGIRGTIIAGEITPDGQSNITVLEGAIVVTNGSGQMTLSEQFETVQLRGFDQPMQDMGVVPAADINTKFSNVSGVNPGLFSMINDAVQEQQVQQPQPPQPIQQPLPDAPTNDGAALQPPPPPSGEVAPILSPTGDVKIDLTAQPLEPIAPLAPIVMDPMFETFGMTTTTGLPDSNIIVGQQSIGTFDANVGSVLPPPPVGIQPSPPLSGALPPPPPPPGGIIGAMPPPPPPGTNSPPPPPPNGGTGGGASTAHIINLNVTGNGVAHLTDNLNNKIGYTISALGDLNDDGFDDFIFSNEVTGQNHTYIVGGTNPTTFTTVVNSAGAVSNTQGTVVAGIGDFDGDGAEDYIVGQKFVGGNGTITIESGDSGENYQLAGTASAQLGASIDGAGDYNNDGYADVIVGAPGANSATFILGNVFGSQTSQTLTGTGAFGTSVSGIGDFNGDGYSDFAVGAPNGAGFVKIYQGSQLGSFAGALTINGAAGEGLGKEIFGLGDVNGDGRSDIMVAGNGNVGQIYFGGDTNVDVNFNIGGGFTIIGGGAAGDFNGDGYDDFTVSLANSDVNIKGADTYVVLGKGTMPTGIDLTYLNDSANAFKLQYGGADRNSELEISSIGDVNGDGYDDIGIGVPDLNGGSAGDGGIIIVNGRGTGAASAIVGTSGNDVLTDGGASGISLRGGAGNDIFNISNTNFLGIDGGGGSNDMLRISGGTSLDFTAINYERVSGIEELIMSGTGNTVTLTLENLFNLLKTSDGGILKVSGATGNTLNINIATPDALLIPSEIEAALETMSGGTATTGTSGSYNTFQIGGYQLLIENTVNVVGV